MQGLHGLVAAVRLAAIAAVVGVPGIAAAVPPPAGDGDPRLTYVGRVVDAAGHPVAGAVVYADNGRPYQTMQIDDTPRWRAFVPDPLASADLGPFTVRGALPTDADGRFRVEGVPGPVGGWVRVVHTAHPPAQRPVDPSLVRGDVVEAGDFVLAAGTTQRVQVFDEDGKGVPGAWVVALPHARDAAGADPVDPDAPGEARAARADAGGRAVLTGLRERRYVVAAFTDDRPPSVVDAEVRRTRSSDVPIRLVRGQGLRVAVRWRDDGAPVEGARVDVVPADARGGRSPLGRAPIATRRSGADGVAAFEGLPSGPEVRVVVVPPDFAADGVHHPGAFSVAAEPDGASATVELDRPCPLPLRVVDAGSGAPVAGVRVRVWASWADYDRTGGIPIDLAHTFPGAAERLVVPETRPGPWNLDVGAPGFHPQRIGPIAVRRSGADGADEVTVTLVAAADVAVGRIVARSTGAPIAGASVATYEWIQRLGDGQRTSSSSAHDGRFRLAPLLGAGFPLRIEVRAPGHVPLVVEQPPDARSPDLGDISLFRSATVRGRMLDASGRTLPRCEVRLALAPREARGKGDLAVVETDADGAFRFDDVAPGSYALVADGCPDESIQVPEGAVVERDLRRR